MTLESQFQFGKNSFHHILGVYFLTPLRAVFSLGELIVLEGLGAAGLGAGVGVGLGADAAGLGAGVAGLGAEGFTLIDVFTPLLFNIELEEGLGAVGLGVGLGVLITLPEAAACRAPAPPD